MISTELSQFACDFSLDQVPKLIATRSKHLILDAIGIAYASSTYDFAKKTLAAVQELGSGEHKLIGFEQTASMRDAMLLNGITIHGLDFDDTHTSGVIHATASSFPCVLALSEKCGATTRDLLEAYILAMEVSTRLGSVAKGNFHRSGFHPTGIVGIFGCTLAAGKLLRLTVEQMSMAQGIALSMASGSFEFLEDGAWNKRLHPGWAASSAVTATMLAKHGFIGATAAYEGRHGFYAGYLSQLNEYSDYSLATRELGRSWEIEDVAVKPMPACHFMHASGDAAAAIKHDHDPNLKDIQVIRVKVPKGVVSIVCEPVANKKRPKNSYDAQFSIPYMVATALQTGDFQLRDLEDNAMGDTERQWLADRVEYEIDPNAEFPRFYPGEVVVEMNDGRVLSHREAINRGNKERPLSNAEVVEKFTRNMDAAGLPEKADEIQALVARLDDSNLSAREFATLSRLQQAVIA